MSDDVAVVWVAPGGAEAGAHARAPDGRDDAARALAEWSRARGLRLTPASEERRGAALRVDHALAERVEKELERARDAIAALDSEVAERALARAEAALRDHPELPQAAWLRAEVYRAWAARWTRLEPHDDARALAAWQEADALDGGRAAGVGEAAFSPRPHTTSTLRVGGAFGRALVARLDGAPLAPKDVTESATTFTLDVAPSEHQLVVTLDGETVFASWVVLAEASPASPAPPIAVHVGDDGACTTGSFARVARDGERVRAPGVTCPRWVVATPAERASAVLVARCERGACGPLLEWRSEAALGGGAAPTQTPRSGAWPTWATWTAVGFGAVAVTTVTLIATGVLQARPTETRIVGGGSRTE